MPAEARTNQLLNAAEICFGRSGYQLTSINSIAKEAGLSKGSVYRFFKTKDDILLALLDKYDREIYLRIEQIRTTTNDPIELIYTFACSFLSYVSSKRDMERVWAEFLLQPNAYERNLEKYEDYKTLVISMIEEAMSLGSIKKQDSRILADLLITLCEGLISVSIIDKEKSTIEKFDEFWPILLKSFQ